MTDNTGKAAQADSQYHDYCRHISRRLAEGRILTRVSVYMGFMLIGGPLIMAAIFAVMPVFQALAWFIAALILAYLLTRLINKRSARKNLDANMDGELYLGIAHGWNAPAELLSKAQNGKQPTHRDLHDMYTKLKQSGTKSG